MPSIVRKYARLQDFDSLNLIYCTQLFLREIFFISIIILIYDKDINSQEREKDISRPTETINFKKRYLKLYIYS